MKDQIQAQSAEGQSANDDSLSEEALIASLAQEPTDDIQQDEAEGEESEDDPEQEEEAEEAETEGEEEAEEEDPDSESDPDFENWTPEQLQEAAKRAKSRLLADLGKLRKENRELAERLQASAPQPDPLQAKTKVENPAVAAIGDIAKLADLKASAEGLEEWAQSLLDSHGAADSDEEIGEYQGKTYTKAQVVGMRNNARAALKRDIPARLSELQAIEMAKQNTVHFDAKIPVQVPEAADENGEVAKTHKALMDDPTVKAAFDSSPALRSFGGLILAHAARSIVLGSKLSKKAPAKPAAAVKPTKAQPPSSPSGAAATPRSNPGRAKDAVVKQKFDRFADSGDMEDLVASLAARYAD